MVRIRLQEDEKGRLRAFTVEGHAGAAKKGRDIVCAGVSAITQTALLGLRHYLPQKLEAEVREGFLSCRLAEGLSAEEELCAEAILETMCLGLAALKETYGRFLRIERCRQGKGEKEDAGAD